MIVQMLYSLLCMQKLFSDKMKLLKNITLLIFKTESREIKSTDKLNNQQLKLINEACYDMEWWNKRFAIEWWTHNGHFNDSLYINVLNERFERAEEQKRKEIENN